MGALTEQLIHDYLRRLFAAGRGRLTRADRRALVMRTRAFIELSTGPVGTVSALDIARFLTALGDPAAVVEAEQSRLADARGETMPTSAAGERGLARVLQRPSRQATKRWPSHPADPQLIHSLMAVPTEEEASAAPTEPVLTGRIIQPAGSPDAAPSPDELRGLMAEESADDGHGGGEPAAAEVIELGPRPSWPTVVATNASWLHGVLTPAEADGSPDAEALDGEAPDEEAPDEEALDEEALDEGELLDEYDVAMRWLRNVARRASLLGVFVADRFRKQPVESVAATLLGIGGAAFPPVWLIGAAVALASRLWDYRDKLAGLALPVLATVVGTVAGVCLTAGASLTHDVHNGWLFADVLSRIAALAGAAYLAWRAVHGKRPPALPPWAKAHKLS